MDYNKSHGLSMTPSSSMFNFYKRRRSSNFSLRELRILVDSVYAHRNLLLARGPNTNTNVNEHKARIWESIQARVNSVNSGYTRSARDVRVKWCKLSSEVKMKASRPISRDPTKPPPIFNDLEQRVLQIMAYCKKQDDYKTYDGDEMNDADTDLIVIQDDCQSKDGIVKSEPKILPTMTHAPKIVGSASVMESNDVSHQSFCNSQDMVDTSLPSPSSVRSTAYSSYDVPKQLVEFVSYNNSAGKAHINNIPCTPINSFKSTPHTQSPSHEQLILKVKQERLEIERKRLEVDQARLALEEDRLTVEKRIADLLQTLVTKSNSCPSNSAVETGSADSWNITPFPKNNNTSSWLGDY